MHGGAQQARALYDFAPSAEDELGFRIGDLITVTDTQGSWWMGSLDGRSGAFPSNYVELYEAGQRPTDASDVREPRPGPRPRPGNTAHTRLLSGAAAPLHVTLRSGGVPPRFTGASWHRWLPAGYCGKLLLATAASWLIQQNLTGSVSVYQEV